MKKIVLTGVESSGKTVLAESLSGYYSCPLVEEYARIYLEERGPKYNQSDLIHILQGQFDLEAQEIMQNPELIICDTGPLVIKVWSLFKYGKVDPIIENALKSYSCDLFVLSNPQGVPFVQDDLRENPNDRDELFQLYLKELIDLDFPFVVVTESFEERLKQVRDAVDGVLGSS